MEALWWIMVLGPVALGLTAVVAFALGHRRGSGPWRAEERQREIERRLTGREPTAPVNSEEPAVIRPSRFHGSKRWVP